MAIRKRQLIDLGVRNSDADKYLSDLTQLMPQYQIDTELRIAHFLAQMLHESAHMKSVEENLNHSGHITAVAPEHDGFASVRTPAGEVLRPLESQAGRKNHRLFVNSKRWWLGNNFRNHGFWRHI